MSTLGLAGYDIFLAKLDKVNFSAIAQLLKKQGWNRKRIDKAISIYCEYLFLAYQNPRKVFVPTKEIDELLHAHLALGSQFDEDCKRLFGCVVHHGLGFGNGDDVEQRAWIMAFKKTTELFKQTFGCDLSGDPAHCFTVSCA